MLPASVFARDNSVKTLNIVYEYPSKAQSLYLSEKGGEVLLGALNSKDDVALKIPISSTGGVVAGNLSVSTESDFITPVAEVSSLNISPGGTAEIPISVLIEKLPENGPEKVGFTVTFSYGKKSLSATFSLTLYPENTPVGNYTFPTSATSATSLVNTGKTVLITKNSALLFLNETNGKTVLAAENFGKFPKGTAYTTGDGTRHILFYDGYIEADGGQYVFITSPSALPGKVIADFGTDAVTLRQTVAFDYANDSPPLAFSDPNAVIVIPSGSKVDFMLSDIVNTGISNVGIITQRNYHSLMDHLGSGKEWDLHRKRDGLFILPPFVTRDNTGVYRGTVDAIRSVMGYIRRSAQKYVILTGSHTLYNTTYDKMLRQHIETGADITIMYNEEHEFNRAEQYDDLRLTINENGRITDLALNPYMPDSPFMGCDAYIMEKTLLEYLVEDAAAHGEFDFMQDVLIKNVNKYRFCGWKYNGYVARLNSVDAFYKHNLALLQPAVQQDLFNSAHPIYTKVKDEVPANYCGSGSARNSVIADGCIIEGEVENSVLFRGVHVGKGAKVKNCILMQATYIGDNSELSYMVLDKGVIVLNGRRLSGHENYPVILRKGVTV